MREAVTKPVQLSRKSVQNYDCEKLSEGEAHSVVRLSLYGVD